MCAFFIFMKSHLPSPATCRLQVGTKASWNSFQAWTGWKVVEAWNRERSQAQQLSAAQPSLPTLPQPDWDGYPLLLLLLPEPAAQEGCWRALGRQVPAPPVLPAHSDGTSPTRAPAPAPTSTEHKLEMHKIQCSKYISYGLKAAWEITFLLRPPSLFPALVLRWRCPLWSRSSTEEFCWVH